MKTPRINQRIRVVDHKTGRVSENVYRIVQVDPTDESIVAVDDSDPEGGVSVSWDDYVEATPEISWEWIRSQVTREVWGLLSAFESWDVVCLEAGIGACVLKRTADLRDRIVQAQRAQKDESSQILPRPALPEFNQLADFERHREQLEREQRLSAKQTTG